MCGDAATLKTLLRDRPELIRERSAREHGATLLHYVGANGVEDYQQESLANSVVITQLLLSAGADVDADLAYGVSSARGGVIRVESGRPPLDW